MQKKKARKGFLFLHENLCCRLVGRGPCAPPGQMRCSAAGHMGPALQGAAVIGADRVARPYAPCHCEPVRAAKQVPLGYRLARQSVSPQRKGRIPTPVTRSLARNDSAARPQGPLCEGAVGAADWGREKTRDVSPSVSASRCHLPRRGRLWPSAPLTNLPGWV